MGKKRGSRSKYRTSPRTGTTLLVVMLVLCLILGASYLSEGISGLVTFNTADGPSIYGLSGSVNTTGVTVMNVTVDGSTNLSANLTEFHTLGFFDGNTLLMNFSHNFTASPINLSLITIDVTSTSMLVNHSEQLLVNETKAVALTDDQTKSLCVKDERIPSIGFITSDCTGTNETLFTRAQCMSGTTTNNVTCTYTNGQFLVAGLEHSGLRVQGGALGFENDTYEFNGTRGFEGYDLVIHNLLEYGTNLTANLTYQSETFQSNIVGAGTIQQILFLNNSEYFNLSLGATLAQVNSPNVTMNITLYNVSRVANVTVQDQVIDVAEVTIFLPPLSTYDFYANVSALSVTMNDVTNTTQICADSTQSFTIFNNGTEPISDITTTVTGPFEVILKPSLDRAIIDPGKNLTIVVQAEVNESISTNTAVINITGVGLSQSIDVDFTQPGAGWAAYPTQNDKYLIASANSFICINHPTYSVNLDFDATYDASQVIDAQYIGTFDDRCQSFQPHNTYFSLNSNNFLNLPNAVPLGTIIQGVNTGFVAQQNILSVTSDGYQGGGHFCANGYNTLRVKMANFSNSYCPLCDSNVNSETNFIDGIDNDCDGQTDCFDLDSCGKSVCAGLNDNICPTPEIGSCNDGLDNDGNGLTDCQDIGACCGANTCSSAVACRLFQGASIIDSCREITAAGVYTLAQNISMANDCGGLGCPLADQYFTDPGTSPVCLKVINSSNVIIDCKGHTIFYDNNATGKKGMGVSSFYSDKLHIQNCIFENAFPADENQTLMIRTGGSSNISISNNTFRLNHPTAKAYTSIGGADNLTFVDNYLEKILTVPEPNGNWILVSSSIPNSLIARNTFHVQADQTSPIGNNYGMLMIPNQNPGVQRTIMVRDNYFNVSGLNMRAARLSANDNSRVVFENNTIILGGNNSEGVDLQQAYAIKAWNNSITLVGHDTVGIICDSFNTTVYNNEFILENASGAHGVRISVGGCNGDLRDNEFTIMGYTRNSSGVATLQGTPSSVIDLNGTTISISGNAQDVSGVSQQNTTGLSLYNFTISAFNLSNTGSVYGVHYYGSTYSDLNLIDVSGLPTGILINASTSINLSTNTYTNNDLDLNIINGQEITIFGKQLTNYTITTSQVSFQEPDLAKLDFSGLTVAGHDLSKDINVSELYISANSSNIGFNRSANLTFYNLSFIHPEAFVDETENGTFVECDPATCGAENYSSGTFVYNVTGFTAFSVQDTGYIVNASLIGSLQEVFVSQNGLFTIESEVGCQGVSVCNNIIATLDPVVSNPPAGYPYVTDDIVVVDEDTSEGTTGYVVIINSTGDGDEITGGSGDSSYDVAVDENGNFIVGGQDGGLKFVNASDGSDMEILATGDFFDWILSVDIDQDGHYIAAGGYSDEGDVWVIARINKSDYSDVHDYIDSGGDLPNEAYGIDIDANGDIVFVGDDGGGYIAIYDVSGNTVNVINDSAFASAPIAVKVDSNGDYITGGQDGYLYKVDSQTGVTTNITSGLTDVFGISIDSAGHYIVTDSSDGELYRVNKDNASITSINNGPWSDGPLGVEVIIFGGAAGSGPSNIVSTYTIPSTVGVGSQVQCGIIVNASMNSVEFNITFPDSTSIFRNGTNQSNNWTSNAFTASKHGDYTCDVTAYKAAGGTDTTTITFNAGATGVIPVGAGTPFFTYDQNPVYPSNLSCLASLNPGETCNQTWVVNATGATGSQWEFFVIYNGSTLVTQSINVTISATSLFLYDDTDVEGGSQTKYPGQNVHFFANYTDLNTTNAIAGLCNFTLAPYVNNTAMAFNASGLEQYRYNTSVPVNGTFDWDVDCVNDLSYANISATDTVLISVQGQTGEVPEFSTIVLMLALGLILGGFAVMRRR